MHEKKKKTYGGIETKYRRELAAIDGDALNLLFAAKIVLDEMRRDDSFYGDIQSEWLNGAYQILLKVEREIADLEEKVKADTQFPDKFKELFLSQTLQPIKDGNLKAHAIDAFIMNGTPTADV